MNSRRKFLFQVLNTSLSLAAANVAVYTVGSAFKNLDGSLVAGAKACTGVPPTPPGHICGVAPMRGWCQDPYVACDTVTGTYYIVPGVGCTSGCR